MSTRYKVQQFAWGFRMYDSQTEEPADGEIARFDVNLDEAELVKDGSTTPNVTYVGKAAIGTATSAAAWQLMKIDKTVTDNTSVKYANGGEFTAVYDDRASETYA